MAGTSLLPLQYQPSFAVTTLIRERKTPVTHPLIDSKNSDFSLVLDATAECAI